MLRIPGMISRRMRLGSPAREAPNSRAPRDPCRPISSAPTTTRKRPPNSSPNDISGTFRKRSRSVMACGSSFADMNQVITAKPTIAVSRTNTPEALRPYSCSPIVTPTTSRLPTSAIMTTVKMRRSDQFLEQSPCRPAPWPRRRGWTATECRPDTAPCRTGAAARNRRGGDRRVTIRETRIGMTTDRTPTTKYRPPTVAMKPGRSSSSRPMRKKRTKIPTLRKSWISPVGSTIPATGPSSTPARV